VSRRHGNNSRGPGRIELADNQGMQPVKEASSNPDMSRKLPNLKVKPLPLQKYEARSPGTQDPKEECSYAGANHCRDCETPYP